MAKKRPNIKLPNGFGSITKLSGNRRNPYMVSITTGWDKTGKQIRETIGYAKDWYEGYEILVEYHKNPTNFLNNLECQNITVDEVYNKLLKIMTDNIGKRGMSKSNYANLTGAYKNHCTPIHEKKILNLSFLDLQNMFNNCERGHTVKKDMKTICKKIFEYGKLYLNINLNLEIVEKIDLGENKKSEMHIPLSNQELKEIWNLYDQEPSDEIEISLMLIYTGTRPQELIDIELDKIFINNQYMIGGCKTQAGKDRTLPIHNDILPFIEKRLTNKKFLIENMPGKKTTYKFIKNSWESVMKKINTTHYPYDARHTLASKLDEYKITHPNSLIDELTIKLILGHAINDVTQNVYIHRDAKYLVEAINLLNLERR